MSIDIDRRTPTLTVNDGRGLAVLKIAYHRRDANLPAEARISTVEYDLQGRIRALYDPRLSAAHTLDPTSPANRSHLYNLVGVPLLSEGVDDGWDVTLMSAAGIVSTSWDARGTCWQTCYDDFVRPISFVETDSEQHSRTISRNIYAEVSDESASHNLCGQVLRAHDTAGTLITRDYNVRGQPLDQDRQFLKTLEIPDWNDGSAAEDLVEPQVLTSRWQYDALGAQLVQIDAKGNEQRTAYSISGDVQAVGLSLADQPERLILSELIYNAFGQVEQQTAGNGVISRSVYDPATGRLQSLTATRSPNQSLQQLQYTYDPVGNITRIEDTSKASDWYCNQRTDPVDTYEYDSLYQLIRATGYETVDTAASPKPPAFRPPQADESRVLNYSESYVYDLAGNMTELHHDRVGNQYTRTYAIAPSSNKSLPITDPEHPPEVESAFDENGNLKMLIPGQAIEWDLRNQLQKVTSLTRRDGNNDDEQYVYDGGNQRVRKVRTALTKGTNRVEEVRYLPGLELRLTNPDTTQDEHLEVIVVPAGRCNVRCLHWVSGKPEGIDDYQMRYNLEDQLGSSTMELDGDARILSQEGYYPYGGTAWWAAESAIEAKYKTIRYSGKERDASGLYYYGFRYYAPWLQRWINPDPSGEVDGLNLYRMVGNRPITYSDADGRVGVSPPNGPRQRVQSVIEMGRDSPSPTEERPESPPRSHSPTMHAQDFENFAAYEHAVKSHVRTLQVLGPRLENAIYQLDNISGTNRPYANLVRSLSGFGLRAVAGGLAGYHAGNEVKAWFEKDSFAEFAGSTFGGLVAGVSADEATVSALRSKNIFQSAHLNTSELHPSNVNAAISSKSNWPNYFLYQLEKLNVTNYSARQWMDVLGGVGLGLCPYAGPYAAGFINTLKFLYDLYSFDKGKGLEKIEELSEHLTQYEAVLREGSERIKNSQFAKQNKTVMVDDTPYGSEIFAQATHQGLAQIKRAQKSLDKAIRFRNL